MKKTCKTHGELSEDNIFIRESMSKKSGKKFVHLSCKLCRSERSSEFYKRNPKYTKEYYKNNNEKICNYMKEWYKKKIKWTNSFLVKFDHSMTFGTGYDTAGLDYPSPTREEADTPVGRFVIWKSAGKWSLYGGHEKCYQSGFNSATEAKSAVERFVKKNDNTKSYSAKFTPEIYLKFLNSMPRFEISFSLREKAYWLNSSDENFYFEGESIEDCLDQAIEEMGFMNK